MNIGDLFFEPAISRHVDQASFVARRWLADRIERDLLDPDCRFVLLTGEPGVGKSGMLAWLSRQYETSLRYFIRSDSVSLLASGSARAVLTMLGHQLAVRQPDLFARAGLDISVEQHADRLHAGGRLVAVRAGELVTSPFLPTSLKMKQHANEVSGDIIGIEADRIVADENLITLDALERIALRDPAARLAAAEPAAGILILVDALDELRFQPAGVSLLEWLASCAELPPNVRIVLSARPDPDLLARFRSTQHHWIREEQVNPREPLAQHDVESYLRQALSAGHIGEAFARRGVQAASVTSRIGDRAAGNFQYAVAYVAAFESAARGQDSELDLLAAPGKLPDDLNSLYSFFLKLIRDTVRDMRIPDREGGWYPAWPAVYQPLLAVLAIAREPVSLAEAALLAGLDVGREWLHEALGRLRQFLSGDNGHIQLFHASMAEFLTSDQARQFQPEVYVDPIIWNQRLVQQSIAQYGDAWDAADPYLRRHLASHAAAASLAMLAALVRDADFLAAADPVMLSPLLSVVDPDLRDVARIYRRARPLLGDDMRANAAYLEEATHALNGPTGTAAALPSALSNSLKAPLLTHLPREAE
jgi:hypothetical protein